MLSRRAGYGRVAVVLGALGAQDRERERERQTERERERDPAGLAVCVPLERGTPAKKIKGS